jgi:3-hydroxybutyryl-CoA dehydrogenase
MNVLLLGNSALVAEWLTVLRAHSCTVLKRSISFALPDDASLITSAEEVEDVDLVLDLHMKASAKRRTLLREIEPRIGKTTPVLVNTVAAPLSRMQSWFADPARVFGIAALPTLAAYPIVEVSSTGANADPGETVAAFFDSLGKRMEVLGEGVAHVFPRVFCMIVNEAVFALQQGIASERDIDTAMTLGVNYPAGPLEWGARMGWKHVLRVLEALHAELGDDRYRPAPLLRSLAAR